jgi:hypothetical protein
MEIKSVIRLSNSLYHTEVSLSDNGLTPVETEAINNFGAPSVECGGNFGATGTTGATGTNTYFSLPVNARFFPTNFPVKQSFSLLDYPVGTTYPPNAAQRADIWRDTIVTRLTAAVIAKREESASSDVGTVIQNIDTTPV